MTTATAPPVLVTGRLDDHLSRWLWLVKWLLVLPHALVLALLWPAFVVLSVIAAFAILFTGRYPQALFDFNAGVLRWTWRVGYYAYSALGTDQYPPFTLRDVPDYPARLEIAYPHHLSRGLVLVKWWLLALPHYLVIGLFLGGGWWALGADREDSYQGPGLIGVLVLVAAVVLAFSGRYPSGIFDLVLGLNRWVLRVAAYAGLMTDVYPPFRLDMGGQERGGSLLEMDRAAPTGSVPAPPPSGSSTSGTIAVVVGALLLLPSLGLLLAGGAALWADQTQRDDAGFVTSADVPLATLTRALVTEPMELHLEGGADRVLDDLLGDVRLQVTSDSSEALFVGIARSGDVARYLAGVDHAVVREVRDPGDVRYALNDGTAQVEPPGQQDIWRVRSAGAGMRELQVPVEDGRWTAVVMNASGEPGISVEADVAATIPSLPWIAAGLIVAGAVFGVGATVLLVLGARWLSTRT